MPDLPKYDGTKDPQEHIAAFELVMNLYGQSSAINTKLFVTTLTGKAQEWFTSLRGGSIETFDQLIQKFTFHFASKRKQKRSATYLFNIRQKEDESLKNFIGRFNNETLEVQDLRIDMMGSTGGRKQLMRITQKYIDEEEINAMKDGEWQGSRDRGRWKDNKEKHVRAEEREPPYRPKFHRYTPLATTRTKALMMMEKSNLLQWPQHTRFTPAKRFSNKYCRFQKVKGHDTEDYQLKDEIKRLVRQGYFKEFILEQGGRSKDHKVGGRTRSRSINRERFEDDGKDRGRENVLVKGVINIIAGGSVGNGQIGKERVMRGIVERTGGRS
ncbi:UNVERIFIED_CONTAM: hypothetical protein Sradi_5685900 [Sesamum radiatum]|uniref:Retrotransposon gag domain-containing protein n=1 Tax=Sesamum radiatum TaxID=300843 RepID=A0AAW2L4U1_SESRA